MCIISLHYLLLFSQVLRGREIVLWSLLKGLGIFFFVLGCFFLLCGFVWFFFNLYITVTATNQVENITHVTDCHQPENSWHTTIKTDPWFLVPIFSSFVRYSNCKFCYNLEHLPHPVRVSTWS